jgi:hypothetical protein
VTVFLRPIGSPLTIGMSGLAIASLVESGFELRWIPASQQHEVGLILLSMPFLLQLIASVFSYLARDGATGATVGVLSVSWAALGLVLVSSATGSRSGALGLELIASGGLLGLSALAVSSQKLLPGATFALAGVRFVTGGIYELGAVTAWRHASAIIGLVVLGLAAYSVLAYELEGTRYRSVLPTFRRGRARLVPAPGPGEQLGALAREPGVRETT